MMIYLLCLFLSAWWTLWLCIPLLSQQRSLQRALAILCALVLVWSGYALVTLYYTHSSIKGIVCTITPLRIGPDLRYGSCAMLTCKEPVCIIQIQGDWAYIRTHHAVGWVPLEALGPAS